MKPTRPRWPRSSGLASAVRKRQSPTIRAWQSGRYAATRSARARERLIEFLPSLLDAFGRTAEPDLRAGDFRSASSPAMPAGLQLFSLLAANPSLLRLHRRHHGNRAAARANHRAADRGCSTPCSIPGSSGRCRRQPRSKELIGAALAEALDYSEALDRARIVGREQAFLIGVRVLSGTLSAEQAGAAYADLAETLIEARCRRRSRKSWYASMGAMPGGQAAVLAMGKLGGHEMTAGPISTSSSSTTMRGRRAVRRRAKSLPGAAILCAFHAAADRGAVGADRRRLALPSRYATPALRRRRDRWRPAVELRRLSAELRPGPGSIWR